MARRRAEVRRRAYNFDESTSRSSQEALGQFLPKIRRGRAYYDSRVCGQRLRPEMKVDFNALALVSLARRSQQVVYTYDETAEIADVIGGDVPNVKSLQMVTKHW